MAFSIQIEGSPYLIHGVTELRIGPDGHAVLVQANTLRTSSTADLRGHTILILSDDADPKATDG